MNHLLIQEINKIVKEQELNLKASSLKANEKYGLNKSYFYTMKYLSPQKLLDILSYKGCRVIDKYDNYLTHKSHLQQELLKIKHKFKLAKRLKELGIINNYTPFYHVIKTIKKGNYIKWNIDKLKQVLEVAKTL